MVKTLVGLHKLFVHPWLDAKGYGSIPAVLSGVLGFSIALRLMSMTPIGWPEAWIVFSCFVGVAIYEAAMTVARLDPVKLLEIVANRLGVGDVSDTGAGPADWYHTPKVPDGSDV